MIKNVIAMITPQAGRIMAKARRPRLRHRSMEGCTMSQNSGMVQYPDATTSARMSRAARSPMDINVLQCFLAPATFGALGRSYACEPPVPREIIKVHVYAPKVVIGFVQTIHCLVTLVVRGMLGAVQTATRFHGRKSAHRAASPHLLQCSRRCDRKDWGAHSQRIPQLRDRAGHVDSRRQVTVHGLPGLERWYDPDPHDQDRFDQGPLHRNHEKD